MDKSHAPIKDENKEATIYHYPLGIEVQKTNMGDIIAINKHGMPTLPGSSGSPIILEKKIVGIHVARGEDTDEQAKFRGRLFNICRDNTYVKLSNISQDYNDGSFTAIELKEQKQKKKNNIQKQTI